jgi:hypothetical protein
MARSYQAALAAIISVLLCNYPVLAGEIEIKDEVYAQLPSDAQEALVAKMKSEGLIAKDDTVTYAGPPAAAGKESLGPAVLVTIAPVACKIIAAAKKNEDLAKCATKADAAAQDQCKQEVEGKFGTVETICNAIKLF